MFCSDLLFWVRTHDGCPCEGNYLECVRKTISGSSHCENAPEVHLYVGGYFYTYISLHQAKNCISDVKHKQFTPPADNLKNKHPCLWTVSIVNNKNNSCIWILTRCISIHRMQGVTWSFSCFKNVNACPYHHYWGKIRQVQNMSRVPNRGWELVCKKVKV